MVGPSGGANRAQLQMNKWLEIRRQKKALRAFFERIGGTIAPLPPGNQEAETDPLWQIYYFRGQTRYFHDELDDALGDLVATTIHMPNVRLPITSFFGACGGKSGGRSSLKEYALLTIQPKDDRYFYIGSETESDWIENIRSYEQRFHFRWPSAHHFCWSNKLYLVNGDQSHHVGAIYRQCIKQNREWHAPCHLSVFDVTDRTFNNYENGELYFFSNAKFASLWEQLSNTGIRLQTTSVGRYGFEIEACRLSGLKPGIFEFASQLLETGESEQKLVSFDRIRTILPPPLPITNESD